MPEPLSLCLTTGLCLLQGVLGERRPAPLIQVRAVHALVGTRSSKEGVGGVRASRDGAGGWSLGYQGPWGVRGALLPSTLTRKMRLSWGVSHRYSPASPLRAPRTRSTCLAPACSSCTRPWLASRSPSLYQRVGPPGPERCTTSSRSPPGVLRTLVWAASGATMRTGGSVGSELGVTRRERPVGYGAGGGQGVGRKILRDGRGMLEKWGRLVWVWGCNSLRLSSLAVLTSHLDSEVEAGGLRG